VEERERERKSGGYLWRYEGYDESTIPQALLDLKLSRGSSTPKAVEQFDPVICEPIAVFESMKEAGEVTGIDVSDISRCTKGKAAHAEGYLRRHSGSKRRLIPFDEPPLVRRPVEQLHAVTGETLQSFESILEAEKMTDVFSAHIYETASGISRQAGGYLWRYYEGDEENPNFSTKFQQWKKPVEQIDPNNGQVLAKFESIREASRKTGNHRQNISRVINGGQRTAGGYSFWRLDRDRRRFHGDPC
jgi:hypothetical protein